MCFDVPKIVRSPGFDHGHDEESRNGQDVKIDILDDYIWTPEWFRVRLGQYRSSGRLSEPPEGVWALMDLVERRGKEQGRGRPQAQSKLGGGGPPFLPPSFLFLPSPTPNRKKGSPTPVGSWTPPPWARHPPCPAPPPLLYIQGQGRTPETQQLIIDLLAVCGAPLHHSSPR